MENKYTNVADFIKTVPFTRNAQNCPNLSCTNEVRFWFGAWTM